jgi:acetylornithine/N-succinyldiaminopimelate aminotransferase
MPYITTYPRLPVTLTHGEGVWVYDDAGKAYFDAFCGIAVTSLGHKHPAVTQAIIDQAQQLLLVSNVYGTTTRDRLSEQLTQAAGMEQVFFCNSGAEANEAALKLARLYGHQKKINNPQVIVTEQAFHGRTLATLSACGSHKFHAGFEPLVPGFVRVPYNDLEAITRVAEHSDDIVAILVEPILGESGVIIPSPGYLRGLRRLCDQHGWLLMLDEVQTGLGRTGALFAFEQEQIIPDVLTLAKALGNGYPIGACLMRGPACNLFKPGNHGSTFGGNPMATRIALTVLDAIKKEGLCANATLRGQQLLTALKTAFGHHPQISDIRGQGLMLAIEFKTLTQDLRLLGLKHGILLNVTNDKIIRLLPPLIMTETDVLELVQRLAAVIAELT